LPPPNTDTSTLGNLERLTRIYRDFNVPIAAPAGSRYATVMASLNASMARQLAKSYKEEMRIEEDHEDDENANDDDDIV
jgi:hypothetical protein